MEANDVRAIGICGIPGIGKTTTAKVLYNKYSNQFDDQSSYSELLEVELYLQQDISEADMYMVKKLRQKESLELFSYHAFGKLLPPVNYVGALSKPCKLCWGSSISSQSIGFITARNLLKVHPSIEQLSQLCHLDLNECGHLRELPETVAQLTKLGHLDLRDCHSLKRLPEQLGNLKGIKVLDPSYTAIEQLPDSDAHLLESVELKLINCKKLRKLPEQFGEMEGLSYLDASSTAIEEVPDSVGTLSRIMTLKTAKEIWDFLKKEYEGSEKIKGMQAINLIREFDLQKMKETETIQNYADRLINIANKVKLLGTEFHDSRIIQKILVTVPEKFEATISSLENSQDLTNITLTTLLNALQDLELRRLMRQEGSVEGALLAKMQNNFGGKNKKYTKNFKTRNSTSGSTNNGHVEKICRSSQQQVKAKTVIEQVNEEDLFAVSCIANSSSEESWLIDSGCTNHMTYDQDLFRDLDTNYTTKVRIGNGVKIAVKGKGTVAIKGCSGLRLISDVLYVPEIDQNLLSVGQLVEKGYKVLFEVKVCLIKDSLDKELFRVQMKGKSFALNLFDEEQLAMHKVENDTMIWHKRMGHFHNNGLLYLKENNLVRGLPKLEKELAECATCQYGK
ncbi:hypothetical protein AgCh_015053 [Apium graveolens]